MTEYVFHLGDRKTGSTAIQTTLAVGGWRCPGLRIAYPAPVNHIPLAASLGKPGEKKRRPMRFAEILEPARDGSADLVLISAEQFEVVDPKVLRAAMAEYMPEYLETARFIAYVRPHADKVVSAYAERMKQGHFLSTMDELFDRTAKRETFVYTGRFLRWRDTFGDRFTLRPMIRDRLVGKDVVRDFMTFAVRGAEFELLDVPSTNESLCLEDLAMLRSLHLRFNPEITMGKASDMQKALAWRYASKLVKNPRPGKRTKLAMHKSLAARVMEFYADDAASLDAEFFEGTPMSDALAGAMDKAVDEPLSTRAEDLFSPSEMRVLDAWTWLVSEMLLADPAGWPEFFRRRNKQGLKELREEYGET